MKQPYVVERILDHFPGLEPDYVARRLRRSSFVSLAKRYLYIAVPKAACTQMKDLLRIIENGKPVVPLVEGVWATRRDMFIHARSNVPLPSLVDLDDNSQKQVLESPEFLRMTVVRNPYTRLVSAWRNKVRLCEPVARDAYLQLRGHLPDVHDKRPISFNEFVGYLEGVSDLRTCNAHWASQVNLTFYPALNLSRVMKIEQLKAGLRHFERHIGQSLPLHVAAKNASAATGSAVYTQELADRVYSLYRRDFEVLGYERDTWPVRQQEKGAAAVAEERFIDEIVERNIVILELYEERRRLRAQLRRVSRLHLLSLANGLAACRAELRKRIQQVGRSLRDTFLRSDNMKRTGAAQG